jgi:hypothetical protein
VAFSEYLNFTVHGFILFVTKKNKFLTKENIFIKGKIENLSDDNRSRA